MDATVERLIGRAWHDDFPWTFLTRLTELDHRLGGSPGERRAAELVADALDDADADPEIRPFDVDVWSRGETDLAVAVERDGERVERSFEAIALPYSPAGDVRASLVDVGHGTPDEIEDADVAGRVAVADTDAPPGSRYVHRMEKYGHAVAAGCDAFVFANDRPGQLPPTGALRFGGPGAVPGVGVSKETGDWLREYAGEGGEVRLRVEATTEPGQSHNVVGRLGPDTGEGVLVVAHLDAHDVAEGALDNGCGVTVAVAAARLLAELDLDSRVWLAGVGCEETGLAGSETLADRLDLDRVRAVVNVDGAGRHRDLRALTHGSGPIRELAERVVEGVGHPLAVSDRPHPYSDHWPFLREGVPALQLHSQRPEGRDRAWERGWTHTRADTRDKADPRTLREHAVLAALVVRELAREDVPPVDTDDLAERLRDAGADPGMRAADVWPDDWD